MSSKPTSVDWESIEKEYRAGQLSLRAIASAHGVSDTAIRKRAKRDGWKRDLTRDVRQRVKAESVRSSVRTANAEDDEEVVQAAAARGVGIIQTHRTSIRRGRTVVSLMLGELEAECSQKSLLEELADQHIDEAELKGQAANAIRKAISLPSRAATVRDLSQAMQRLIGLERQAYNLDEEEDETGSLADALQKARKRARQLESDADDAA